jgi:hypothetical protein
MCYMSQMFLHIDQGPCLTRSTDLYRLLTVYELSFIRHISFRFFFKYITSSLILANMSLMFGWSVM